LSTPHAHHRIRSLSVQGGFLDGARFEFTDGLNCLIGPRGAGKTTVLELIRWATNTYPEKEPNPDYRKHHNDLIKSNLKDGRVQLVVETKDGLTYTIDRTLDGEMLLFKQNGQSSQAPLETFFQFDIYSQNEVESIAADRPSQLALVDKFAIPELEEVAGHLRKLDTSLAANERELIEVERQLQDLSMDLTSKEALQDQVQILAGKKKSEAPSQGLEAAHRASALREREKAAMQRARKALEEHEEPFTGLLERIANSPAATLDPEILKGANGESLKAIQDLMRQCHANLRCHAQEALKRLQDAREALEGEIGTLRQRHDLQESEFRSMLEKEKEGKGYETQRVLLEKKLAQFQDKERVYNELKARQDKLVEERAALLERLSEHRDQRFQVRKRVAEAITKKLERVQVRVMQQADRGGFKALLAELFSNARMNHKIVAQKIAESSIQPQELARMVLKNDKRGIMDKAGLNENQANQVVDALYRAETLSKLEVVEQPDEAIIELWDEVRYKDTLEVSPGLKCTALLPILLLESENPLLIDQPEDNLDGSYIYHTIVKCLEHVKTRRQIVLVTHNANIPTLPDADKVFVLKSDGLRARCVKEGSVDDCKQGIVDFLEGGREAFLRRKKRYDY